jgi:hypothetical protein
LRYGGARLAIMTCALLAVVACGKREKALPSVQPEVLPSRAVRPCVEDCTKTFHSCIDDAQGSNVRTVRCRQTLGRCTGECAQSLAKP